MIIIILLYDIICIIIYIYEHDTMYSSRWEQAQPFFVQVEQAQQRCQQLCEEAAVALNINAEIEARHMFKEDMKDHNTI